MTQIRNVIGRQRVSGKQCRHPEWPMRTISDLSVRITKGSSPNWQGINYTSKEEGILFITSENVGLGQLLLDKPKYVEQRFNAVEPKSKRVRLPL